MQQNEPIIDKIVSILVSTVDPDQIMLFGSYARGDFTEKSDIDVLILKKGLSNKKDIIAKLYHEIYSDKNDINIDIDLLAIDFDRYHEINNDIGFIYHTIKEEGKVLYGH